MKSNSHEQPFRISITGIDGSGKDGVTTSVLEMLSMESPAIQIGKPSFMYEQGKSHEIFRPVNRTVDTIHDFGDRHQYQKLILGISAVNVVVQARILERLAEHYQPHADIIASNRDTRIDSAVYMEYYGNKSKNSSTKGREDQIQRIQQRINRVQRLTKIKRDLIITLAVDPEIAIQRIEDRIAKDKLSGAGKESPRQMHETIGDLAMLAAAYEPASQQLQVIQPHRAVTIDTSDRSFEEVVDITYRTINSARQNQFGPGHTINL